MYRRMHRYFYNAGICKMSSYSNSVQVSCHWSRRNGDCWNEEAEEAVAARAIFRLLTKVRVRVARVSNEHLHIRHTRDVMSQYSAVHVQCTQWYLLSLVASRDDSCHSLIIVDAICDCGQCDFVVYNQLSVVEVILKHLLGKMLLNVYVNNLQGHLRTLVQTITWKK